MIIQSLCNTCFQVYELTIEPGDTELVKQMISEDLMVKCPRLCGGRINVVQSTPISTLSSDPRLKPPLPISVRELFKAVNGIGLPDEIPSSMEAVDALLQVRKVVETRMTKQQGKIYLHELHLEGGVVVHLAAGMHGAQVLKVTKG